MGQRLRRGRAPERHRESSQRTANRMRFRPRFGKRSGRRSVTLCRDDPVWLHFRIGQYPIHRNGPAIRSRANQFLPVITSVAACDLNHPTSDNLSAMQTIPLVVERVPAAELIKPPQSLKLLLFCPVEFSRRGHSPSMPIASLEGQSGDRPTALSAEILLRLTVTGQRAKASAPP
jgi:hypothetical protein